MSEPESPQTALQVRCTETSAVVRTLEVEVGAPRVDRAFERFYRDLARRVRVRGFRPGKAPRSVLERLYGGSAAEEIERALVGETLPEAVTQAGLRPVTEPSVSADAPTAGKPFRFSARIEVKPEIRLPALEGLQGRRPPVEASDADVVQELETLRQRHATLIEEPEGTVASRGHVLTIDFVGRIDGQPFEGGSGQDVALELGAGQFLPGFEEQLEGTQAGEDREVRVSFPADYGRSELAGKEAVFAVHVAAVRRRELPALDDEFAKDVGEFESLAALREHLLKELRAAREREAQAVLRRSLLDGLLTQTSFDVPAGLVDRRLQRRLAAAHQQLEGQVPHDTLHAQLERWQEEWRPAAEREVREALVLEAVAQAREIVADDAEVDARLASLAAEQGVDAARLRKAYREQGLLEAVRAQLVDEKALEALCRDARIEEVARG